MKVKRHNAEQIIRKLRTAEQLLNKVLEGPHGAREIGAGGGDHASFTSGAEDFVLAEAPGGPIAETANGLTMDPGTNDVADCYDSVNWRMMGPCRKQPHPCACNRN